MSEIIDEFVLEPSERGIIILVPGELNNYIGKDGSVELSVKLEHHFGYSELNELGLFESDEAAIKFINELRENGKNALLLDVFRDQGETIIEDDLTEYYFKKNYIKKIRSIPIKYEVVFQSLENGES